MTGQPGALGARRGPWGSVTPVRRSRYIPPGVTVASGNRDSGAGGILGPMPEPTGTEARINTDRGHVEGWLSTGLEVKWGSGTR